MEDIKYRFLTPFTSFSMLSYEVVHQIRQPGWVEHKKCTMIKQIIAEKN